jgi:rhamnosyltransferase
MALSFSSDFYLFMTQDALPLDNFLIENLINSLENQKLALAYARQIPRDDASPLEKFSRLQNYPENSLEKFIDDIPRLGIKTFFSSNSCAIYCADIFKKFGGFSPSAHVSEDMHFAATAMKAGYGISYCAKAQVYHSHNYTLSDLYVRYKNIGSFFKKNYWLLDMTKKNVSLNQTGLSFVSLQLKYLLRNQPLYVLRLLIETAIKYIAYKKGMLGEQK